MTELTRTPQEILDNAAHKVSQILDISLDGVDKTKLVYLYTLLFSVIGNEDENMKHWMNTYNKHLNFCPVTRLTDKDGIQQIISYLESFL